MSGLSSITAWQDGDPLSPTVLNSKLLPIISSLSNLSIAGVTPVVVQSNSSTIGSFGTFNFQSTLSQLNGAVVIPASTPVWQDAAGTLVASSVSVKVGSDLTVTSATSVSVPTLNSAVSFSFITGQLSTITTQLASLDTAPGSLVTGYRIYLEADTGMSAYTDGDSVSTWFDQSGNALNFNSFSVSTDRPTFKSNPDADGHPLVRFNGVNTGLKRTSNISYTGTDLTVALLVRSAGRSQTNSVIFGGMDAGQSNIGSDNFYCAVDGTFHGMVAAGHQGGASQQYGAQAQPIAGTAYRMAIGWRVFIFRWSTITTSSARYMLSVYDNGSQAAFTNTSHPFAYTQLGLGGNINNAASGWDSLSFQEFDLRALALWEFALRDDQIRQVQRYFGVKYKIPGLA